MALADVGFLAQANAEIRAAQRRHEFDRVERMVERRRIYLIDALITDLERLNVKSAERVPLAYEPRLARLRSVLSDAGISAEQLQGIRTRIAIERLMDELFAVQESCSPGSRRAFRSWPKSGRSAPSSWNEEAACAAASCGARHRHHGGGNELAGGGHAHIDIGVGTTVWSR